jgi:hypothetical protein
MINSETQPISNPYERMCSIIEEVVDKPIEDKMRVIEERLREINTNDYHEISIFRDFHEGFIGDKVGIVSNLQHGPFFLDDPEMYMVFLNTISDLKDGWGGEIELKYRLPNIIQRTIYQYFGNLEGPLNLQDRINIYGKDLYGEETPKTSIKEFKEKGVAMCSEKAAFAQNLLVFMGLESGIILSKCKIPDSDQEEPHTFILIHLPNDKHVIYDPTNPTFTFKKDKSLVSYGASIYGITSEQKNSLMGGKPIRVEHKNIVLGDNGKKNVESHYRIYFGPKNYRN